MTSYLINSSKRLDSGLAATDNTHKSISEQLADVHIYGQPSFRYISPENRSFQPSIGSLMPQSINFVDYLPR